MKKIACLLLLIHSGFIIAQTKTVVTQYGEKVEINPFADNGLNAFNGSVQLGGNLLKTTILTTTSDFTLAIKGLQPGSPSNDILVSDVNGVLKTINASSFAWNIVGNSGTNSTANFIGTIDNQPLNFKINNTNAGKLATRSTAFGYDALTKNTNNFQGNTAFGVSALASNTSGYYNVAIGDGALKSSTTSYSNIAIGHNALTSSKAYQNVAIGTSSLEKNTTGNGNVGVGFNTLAKNVGANYNVALGYMSLAESTSGDANVGIGAGSLGLTKTGSNNVAIGQNSLANNVDGFGNTAIGDQALYNLNNVKGHENIAIGVNAGTVAGSGASATSLTNARQSIFIGSATNANANNENNQIVIGYTALGRGSNTVQIGNSDMTSIGGQVAWSNPSDVRLKKEIKDSEFGLNFITKLRPVTYKMKTGTTDLQSGFIAQEVEAAANSINYQFSGIVKPQTNTDFYSLRYSEFVVPLVKAVQEQQKIIEAKEAKILEIENRLMKLEQKIK